MPFALLFTAPANCDLDALEQNKALEKQCRAVKKALGLLQANPRHPGLNTPKYSSLEGANGEEIFEAYAENNTPAFYRIFWHYGSGKGHITIIAITAHP